MLTHLMRFLALAISIRCVQAFIGTEGGASKKNSFERTTFVPMLAGLNEEGTYDPTSTQPWNNRRSRGDQNIAEPQTPLPRLAKTKNWPYSYNWSSVQHPAYEPEPQPLSMQCGMQSVVGSTTQSSSITHSPQENGSANPAPNQVPYPMMDHSQQPNPATPANDHDHNRLTATVSGGSSVTFGAKPRFRNYREQEEYKRRHGLPPSEAPPQQRSRLQPDWQTDPQPLVGSAPLGEWVRIY